MLHIFADPDESNYWAKVFLCALLAGLVVVTLTACSAKSDEEIIAASERAAHDKKITYRLPDGRIFEATFPLEYTATASQCRPEDGCKKRYYHPRQR